MNKSTTILTVSWTGKSIDRVLHFKLLEEAKSHARMIYSTGETYKTGHNWNKKLTISSGDFYMRLSDATTDIEVGTITRGVLF
jgi:hypothetical protein